MRNMRIERQMQFEKQIEDKHIPKKTFRPQATGEAGYQITGQGSVGDQYATFRNQQHHLESQNQVPKFQSVSVNPY